MILFVLTNISSSFLCSDDCFWVGALGGKDRGRDEGFPSCELEKARSGELTIIGSFLDEEVMK